MVDNIRQVGQLNRFCELCLANDLSHVAIGRYFGLLSLYEN